MWDLTVPGNNDHDFYVIPARADGDGAYPVSTGGESSVLVHNANTGCGVTPYQVGTYRDLKAASKSGDGLDIHHVPQGQPAAQVIPGYEYADAPAIALPRAEHALIPNLRGPYAGTSQDLIAQDLGNLGNYTNAPQSSIDQLVALIGGQYPGAR
jgi:hypothetical protein